MFPLPKVRPLIYNLAFTKTILLIIMIKFVIILSIIGNVRAILYDAYSGELATEEQLQLYKRRNNTRYCIVDIKPCNPEEWKRIDGSCNNLKYPSTGAPPTPTTRFLSPEFSVDYEPRTSKSGRPLPLERKLRTELLEEGKASELDITIIMTYFLNFVLEDINSINDILNYLGNTTDCCTSEGRSNYACTPSKIPVHDPVHRYSGVRCQNLTRPQSFQYFGCRDFGTTFTRIVFATLTFDLSQVYATDKINQMRTFTNGLLKIDSVIYKENGKIFPPANYTEAFNKENCVLNQYPRESYCFKYNINTVPGSSLFMILFYRQHNYIAKMLHDLNPCWNDDLLFYTARDINIAICMQIYLYELLPILLGKNNMVNDGIINPSGGFRDIYDENIRYQMTDEFVYINRWFHIIQEAQVKLYDEDGVFLRTFPVVNGTKRMGYLLNDNNIDKIFQGSFRQPTAKFDNAIDFDIAERAFGGLQFAFDVATSDMKKSRYFGFPSYVKYRNFCTKKEYNTFDDLKDVIGDERLYRLREVYDDVDDVELMPGLYAEKYIGGGRVPHTLYCLITKQLKRSIASDRYWYERANRPHAFNAAQLQAIRKVTLAGMLCTVGNPNTRIQPQAFYSIDSGKNPLTECRSQKIGKLDLSPWKDYHVEMNKGN